MKKWVCQVCGYVFEGENPPEKCPQCGVPASKFTEQKGEMSWAAEHVVGVAQGAPEEIIEGLRANFSGDLPTLIVQNVDQPGHVSEVTSMLAHKGVNIATMQLYRDHPGGNAVMIIETDKAVPPEGIAWLERSEGITRVTFIDAEREA